MSNILKLLMGFVLFVFVGLPLIGLFYSKIMWPYLDWLDKWIDISGTKGKS